MAYTIFSSKEAAEEEAKRIRAKGSQAEVTFYVSAGGGWKVSFPAKLALEEMGT